MQERQTSPNWKNVLKKLNQFAVESDARMKQFVDELRVQLPKFNLVLDDSFGSVTAVLANGKRYGN